MTRALRASTGTKMTIVGGKIARHRLNAVQKEAGANEHVADGGRQVQRGRRIGGVNRQRVGPCAERLRRKSAKSSC